MDGWGNEQAIWANEYNMIDSCGIFSPYPLPAQPREKLVTNIWQHPKTEYKKKRTLIILSAG